MRIVLATGAALVLSACAPPPVVTVGPDPADPAVQVRATTYRPVLAGTGTFGPVEPKPWAATNEAVGPRGKGP
ncbi:hypothetical protein [Prosthecomicrobium sp. N25]|uniref:hypothetical protein n=1 Tax=Prosthecomicrobium sp. N25 TaxID=3129254 RepID=UPI0030778080